MTALTLFIAAATCLLLLCSGCRPAVGPPVDSPAVESAAARPAPDAVAPIATPTVAEQIQAVQAGTATRLRVADRPLSALEWQEVARLEALEELTLERGRADDTHAVLVGAFPRLRRMVLRESPLTDEAGSEHQTFHIRDGLGIKLWQQAG